MVGPETVTAQGFQYCRPVRRKDLRKDYGGEQSGGFLEAFPFFIYHDARPRVCFVFQFRWSLSAPQVALSFSPTPCLPVWLERGDSFRVPLL